MTGDTVNGVFLTALILPALLAACGDASQGSSTSAPFSVTDSAGVEVAVNGGEPDSAALGHTVDLEIGVTGGDAAYELDDVGAIDVTGDGTIVAANQGDGSIRVFAADGTFMRQFGRRGQGPGEFRGIDGLWVRGDTVVALDRWNQRATVFALDGTLLGTWDLRVPDMVQVNLAALTDVGPLAWARTTSRRFDGDLTVFTLFRDTLELRPYEPAGPSLGPVLVRQATERGIVGAEVYPSGPLFEPLTVSAIAPDGTFFTAPDGQYDIHVHAPDGSLARRVTRTVPPMPITSEHVDAVLERTGTTGERGRAVARSAEHPTADAFQRIGALLAADDGSLLLLRLDEMDPVELEMAASLVAARRPGAAMMRSAARWDLIDPEGRYQGAVRLPERFQPRWFDGSRAMGVQEDELGVQRIVRIRIGG